MSKFNNQYYLFANWKMYLDYAESVALAKVLAAGVKKFPDSVKMAVFPSALAIPAISETLNVAGIGVGAQNVYWVEKGGYTGEVSAPMFKSAGCQYALIGHSERRHLFHETNHEVRQKIEAALNAGLTPVICVGETAEERKNQQTDEVVETQVRAALDALSWPEGRELIIAYEPVWAIGTGDACEAGEAQRLHQLIKELAGELIKDVPAVILYGGSVRAGNVADYLTQPDIHGVLVGGASAKVDSWLEIVNNSAAVSYV